MYFVEMFFFSVCGEVFFCFYQGTGEGGGRAGGRGRYRRPAVVESRILLPGTKFIQYLV